MKDWQWFVCMHCTDEKYTWEDFIIDQWTTMVFSKAVITKLKKKQKQKNNRIEHSLTLTQNESNLFSLKHSFSCLF